MVVAGACVPPTTVVKRSAMVPHAAPIQRSGQPMGTNLAELSLGTDTVASASAPDQGDPNAGLVIPRYQSDIADRIRGRTLRDLDFGLVYRRAFAEDATAIASDIPNPGRAATVYGMTIHHSIATSDEHFRLGIAAELSVMDVPYVIFESCIANCEFFDSFIDERSELVLGGAAALVPSWHFGRFTFFGGATARNHPTIDKRDVRTSFVRDIEGPTSGSMMLILSAGIEAELGGGLRGSLGVYQPAFGSPVEYSPTINASLTIPLFREAPVARGQAVALGRSR
jgi:hypothetical protein